jgi:peroxiredoxin
MILTLSSVIVALLLAFAGWVTFHLLAQNGRILERIDRLEQALVAHDPLKKSRLVRDGLRAGTVAPGFQLPRVQGGELSLAQYRGQRLLLVFSDPKCGPCNQLAPMLQRLHADGSDLAVVMISRGDTDANIRKIEEHGVTFPVALQRQWEISRLYGMFATPIGYLIDEAGVIAAPVAVGTDRIMELVTQRGIIWHSFTPRPRQAQA